MAAASILAGAVSPALAAADAATTPTAVEDALSAEALYAAAQQSKAKRTWRRRRIRFNCSFHVVYCSFIHVINALSTSSGSLQTLFP